MRTKNSFLNMLGVLFVFFIRVLMSFLGKTLLIRVMGDEYNGINGLFSNVISMLSIAELGIGSAIIYNLYKPVKENDIESIKSIMAFYRKCYHIIAIIVFAAGICIMPLVPSMVGKVPVEENIYLLFFLFLFDAVASYLFSYKRSILYVYQKNYVISACDIIYTMILQVSQIMVLVCTKNYIFFLILGIVCRVLENVLISFYADKKFPYLKGGNSQPVKQEIKEDIKEKVRGLLFHNIGGYVVFGTDNIIISRMVGVVAVGFYSNYLVVINTLSALLSQLITAVQSSVGNLLVEENRGKNYQIYRKLAVMNFWLYTAVSVCIFYLIQDFISLWLGDRYRFETAVVFMMVLNFWQGGMRNVIGMFKGAAGIFYEDRFVPLIESAVNIVASVILTYYFGMLGVLIGTFISTCILFAYSYPVLVFVPLFEQKLSTYIKEQAVFVLQWIGVMAAGGIAAAIFDGMHLFSNAYLSFVGKGVLLFCITNFCLFLLYRKCEEYQFFKGKLLDICRILQGRLQ